MASLAAIFCVTADSAARRRRQGLPQTIAVAGHHFFVIFTLDGIFNPTIVDPTSPGGGLTNRIALAVFFAWYVVTALRLLAIARARTQAR